ncbi:hypothetical protein GOZ90_01240 [Agrobacterium vitis]|uniref:Uncharacterized protein n=1 Tax=Agrobacterium vitis TaxID=373 RepID=A0A6L6VAJ8_AGRVI|nr:hypothetical protein [Agrobacterium vitis]MUZ71287.1 hypothetical protein [Agrobacterium vitis]
MIEAIWTDNNFLDMGWHDCRLYAIKLPTEEFGLSFDLDYILRWHREGDVFTGFDVAPCVLTFFNVSRLTISLDYAENLLCFISDIHRSNERTSPNGLYTLWDYRIDCDVGSLSFTSTGFEQRLTSPPLRSDTQDLNRERLVID